MGNANIRTFAAGALGAVLAMPAVGHAQPQLDPVGAPLLKGVIEAGLGHQNLTGGNADWNDQYVRGNLQLNSANLLNAEVSHQSHFDDDGTFFGAGLTHVFDDDWYAFLGAGGSAGGFFLPKLRVDGFVYRKWLEKRNLVTSIGYGYYQAKEVYTDHTLVLGATYYFEAPWIVEVGARLNRSSPGEVRANRGFAAVTYGRDKRHYLTLRYDDGHEAYQLVGATAALSDIASREASLTWRQWVTRDFGFNLRAVRYENPSYERSGAEAGIFWDF